MPDREPSALWTEAYEAKGPDRDDMFDWLEARCLRAGAEVVRLREALRVVRPYTDDYHREVIDAALDAEGVSEGEGVRSELGNTPRQEPSKRVPAPPLTSPVDTAALARRVKSLEGAVYGSLGAEPGPVEP